MLLGDGLPKTLWGEVATTEAYLFIKYPLARIDFKTPMEV